MKPYWEIEVLPWIFEEVIDVIFFSIAPNLVHLPFAFVMPFAIHDPSKLTRQLLCKRLANKRWKKRNPSPPRASKIEFDLHGLITGT
jgi:hypothetical protein